MREIKFRAWNGKEMFYPETENNSDTFNAGFNAGRVEIRDYTTGIEDNLCIPMQFTGLHDKNGKEIYEGDVVKGINLENFYWIEPVTFIDNGWFPFIEHRRMTDFEVIGNIYENPKLLNKINK